MTLTNGHRGFRQTDEDVRLSSHAVEYVPPLTRSRRRVRGLPGDRGGCERAALHIADIHAHRRSGSPRDVDGVPERSAARTRCHRARRGHDYGRRRNRRARHLLTGAGHHNQRHNDEKLSKHSAGHVTLLSAGEFRQVTVYCLHLAYLHSFAKSSQIFPLTHFIHILSHF